MNQAQAPSMRKRMSNVCILVLGHSLIVIALYAIYRIGTFILGLIELPPNIANLGIAASVIMITMGGTGFLLRFDMKPVPNRIHLRR